MGYGSVAFPKPRHTHEGPYADNPEVAPDVNFLMIQTAEELVTAFHGPLYYMEPIRKDGGESFSDNYSILNNSRKGNFGVLPFPV